MAHEFDGEKYSQTSVHQKEWGSRIISELSLRGCEKILDLGCGDGALTSKLAEMVPDGQVKGIDASQGMIEVARKWERDNLKFVLKDIETLDYDGEFDLIFSNATLHWIKDHEKLLRNCHRALRPGGKLRFNFAAEGNCSHFNEVVKKLMLSEEYIDHFSGFDWPWHMPSLKEYELLVKRCAFNTIRIWGENADRYFPNVDAMVGWIDQPAIVPFLKVLKGEDAKQSFRRKVVCRMFDKTKQTDGTCFETFRRINVYAEKN